MAAGDGTPVGEPLTGHDNVTAVAVGALRDGTPVIVSDSTGDGTVRMWRLANGIPLAHPLGLSRPVNGIVIHDNIIVTAAGTDIAVHQPGAP